MKHWKKTQPRNEPIHTFLSKRIHGKALYQFQRALTNLVAKSGLGDRSHSNREAIELACAFSLLK